MGTYPDYIERIVSESRDERPNVEFDSRHERAEAAD